jgi:hypothetical protein
LAVLSGGTTAMVAVGAVAPHLPVARAAASDIPPFVLGGSGGAALVSDVRSGHSWRRSPATTSIGPARHGLCPKRK